MSNSASSRMENESKRSSIVLFLIALNSVIVYLITDLEIFLTVAEYSLGLFVIYWYLFGRNKSSEGIPESKTRVISTIRLGLKFIKLNRRYLILSIFGITIAVMIISQSIIFTNTFEQHSFDNYIGEADVSTIKIDLDKVNRTEYNLFVDSMDEGIESWAIKEDLNLVDYNTTADLNMKLLTNITIEDDRREVSLETVQTINLDSKWSDFQDYPSFPSEIDTSSEPVILIIREDSFSNPYSYYNITNESKTGRIMVMEDSLKRVNSSYTLYNLSIQIDYIWLVSMQELLYATENGFPVVYNSFVMNQEQIWSTYEDLEEIAFDSNQTSNCWGKVLTTTEVFVDIPEMKQMNLVEYTDALQRFRDRLSQFVDEFRINIHLEYSEKEISSPIIDSLMLYNEEFASIQFVMLLMNIPIILTSVFLLVFAYDALKRFKEQYFFMLLTRGVSSGQLLNFNLVEGLLTSFLSITIGMMLSIPLVIYEFSLSSGITIDYGYGLIIPESWYWKLPLLGLLMILELSLITRVSSDSLSWVDNYSPSRHEPFWKRWNIPVIILILSLIIQLVLTLVNFTEDTRELAFIAGDTNILLIILTLPLVLSNYILRILGYFSQLGRKGNRYLTIIVHNLTKHNHYTYQFTSIIIAVFLVMFVSVSVSYSVDQWAYEQNHYKIGGDLLIEVHIPNSNYIDSVQEQLTTVDQTSGVQSTSSALKVIYGQTNWDVAVGEDRYVYSILGLNSLTATNTLYWQDDYSDYDLNSILSLVADGSMAMKSDELQKLDLNIDDSHLISYGSHGVNTLSVRISASFDYFPYIATQSLAEQRSDDLKSIHLVTNFDRALEISSIIRNDLTLVYFVNLEDDVNAVNIKNVLEENLEFDEFIVSIADDPSKDYFLKNQISFLISANSGIILFSLMLATTAIILYALLLRSSRAREIMLYRVLGLKNGEIIQLIRLEMLLLVVIGILLAFISSIGIVHIVIALLTSTDVIQASIGVSIKYDWIPVMITLGSTLIITLIVSRLVIEQFFKELPTTLLRE
ncbi:MAG: hypothetical protein INQ03_11655 [Candidatus Heimdallarchaeota archaeon]|nr:hypothetical protein [Candidatus Heimdallarchaeota archaeon]